MKKLIALTALYALTADLTAGEGWLTNLDKAKVAAKKEGKIILVEFTGSDWCPPCKALKKTVFNSDTFKKYAKSSLVLVELDSPRGKNLITKSRRRTTARRPRSLASEAIPR
jgi:thioredoxin-related protein